MLSAILADDAMNLYTAACTYVTLAQHERALDCLERAADLGGLQLGWLRHDSDMDPIRDEPRFRAVMDRL